MLRLPGRGHLHPGRDDGDGGRGGGAARHDAGRVKELVVADGLAQTRGGGGAACGGGDDDGAEVLLLLVALHRAAGGGQAGVLVLLGHVLAHLPGGRHLDGLAAGQGLDRAGRLDGMFKFKFNLFKQLCLTHQRRIGKILYLCFICSFSGPIVAKVNTDIVYP